MSRRPQPRRKNEKTKKPRPPKPKKAAGPVFSSVHSLVARIPYGKVATYGQLSELIDGRLSPAGVGWALRAAPSGLPWYRVINSRGTVSTDGETPGRQRAMLEAEGVRFDDEGAIDLDRYQWRPRVRHHRDL